MDKDLVLFLAESIELKTRMVPLWPQGTLEQQTVPFAALQKVPKECTPQYFLSG